ncbi:MAG TPA: FKBP-type peptidyl-prolyl cis-trans isomerase [Candidatus Didemnitutus sp.]|nr:FKBP-type peptidyl-prolyl cis-trans isomerase [Candidatus Didemnitutus sp.]
MKKSPPPPAPSPARFWRPLAVLALVTNLGLAVWLWRVSTHPTVVEPTPSASAAVTTRPRELAPYAALGSFMAESNRISELGWNEAQFAAFLDGFRATYEGRGLPLDDAAKKLRDDISHRVQEMLKAERPNPLEDYFRSLREKEGVIRTASGLHYRITEAGNGPKPKPSDIVTLSFAASTPGGESLPQLSRTRTKMALKDLLPGLTEGVQLLQVGGKALLYIPPELAFSDAARPPQLPAGAPLVIFVELHDIESATTK